MKKLYIFILVLLELTFIVACNKSEIKDGIDNKIQQKQVGPAQTSIANPASENCVKKGGYVKIEKIEGLGEYGACMFEDNRVCEERALFRNECPAGGVKITGYLTEESKFCAITGGTYFIKLPGSDTIKEKGNCMFKNDTVCDAEEYYLGKCLKDGSSNKLISTVKFNCKDNKMIDASFYNNYVAIKLSDGRNFTLPQGMSASGIRYTNNDESIIFWNKGNTSFVLENNQETFSDCNEEVK